MEPYKTVVQGEASESEEDDDHPSSGPRPVIVEGEDSESEEEIDTSSNSAGNNTSLKSTQSPHSSINSMDESGSPSHAAPRPLPRPKYDTILNRRLWESNYLLCNNLNAMVSHLYSSAAKELSNYSQQLTKSHTAIQDVSHHMRLMTNDLFHLDDRIDIIATCKLLPDITFPKESSAGTL